MNARRRISAALLALACAAAHAADAPRWWCPLAAPSPAHANDAVLTDALAQLDAQPHPMAHVHTQGLLPHQGIHDASDAAERDWPLALRAAVAWRLSGRPELLQQTTRYLDAWATTYQPDFNPIDETNLADLFQAWALTRDALPASTRDAAQSHRPVAPDAPPPPAPTNTNPLDAPDPFTAAKTRAVSLARRADDAAACSRKLAAPTCSPSFADSAARPAATAPAPLSGDTRSGNARARVSFL